MALYYMWNEEKLETIDPVIAAKLQKAGITSLEELLEIRFDENALKHVSEVARLEPFSIRKFASHADLMRVKGIGQEYSTFLEHSGITSVYDLIDKDPADLYDYLASINERNQLVHSLASESTLKRWISFAKYQIVEKSERDRQRYFWHTCRNIVSDEWSAIERVRIGFETTLLFLLGEYLGLTKRQLSGIVQVSERTLVRRQSEPKLSPRESEKLYRVLKIVNLAAKVFGDRQEAKEWLKEPNYSLQEKTPLEIAQTEPGAALVERLLYQIQYGIAA